MQVIIPFKRAKRCKGGGHLEKLLASEPTESSLFEVWGGGWGLVNKTGRKHCQSLGKRLVNKLKTTPTPNRNGSYGIRNGSYSIQVGVRMP